MMKITDPHAYQRHCTERTPWGEFILVATIFASMGAITWAIRGTSGWNGIDGTILPGMTWGLLWWYVCWRKGIDARGVPLWLGLGLALGGELGYGQYVSWIRGMFEVGDEIVPIAPWLGYAWFGICGLGWAAPGGIALGWALSKRTSLGMWLARLAIPIGAAFLARMAVQTWPWLFFPKWDLGIYVPQAEGTFDMAAAAAAQRNMLLCWLAAALLGLVAWLTGNRRSLVARGVAVSSVTAMSLLLLLVAQWLFFPPDQVGLFSGPLGENLGRTVYTNSQNAIVVGWWIGAMIVAALGRDRQTLFAGMVIGAGFAVGFPLSAVWCLGYEYAPQWIDWWKIWELNSGLNLGLLYAVALYGAMRQMEDTPETKGGEEFAPYEKWCRTISRAAGAFLLVYVMSRMDFFWVGILLGTVYVAAISWAASFTEGVADRRRAVSFVYSAVLLVFILAWGGSSQAGIVLGLYDAKAVDQYAWPPAREMLFLPCGLLITFAAAWNLFRAVWNPHYGLPQADHAPRIKARMVDLMTFTAAIGALSIWPAKIGILYAVFLGVALFALNRWDQRFDNFAGSPPQN